ncbi:MAG: type I-C CRISPR-associated protein Cas7/Csd2 [Spirochaetes bacterium]|nr:type I-C CRISPR-associated protein Cas7/Csd2 [Spirochaetota bacterium]
MTDSKALKNKIDFAVIISVKRANPNGDPLNGNRPRQTYDGFGEISDVCLKRKMRNRLQDMGESIFVQSDDNRADDFRSLNDRFKNAKEKWDKEFKEKNRKSDKIRDNASEEWFDVRAFGQVFAFKAKKGKDGDDTEDNSDAVSIGIRGPVTIQSAFSIEPITPDSLQITKSVNLETENNPDKKSSDTMGMKHRVDKGVYVTFGAINTQLASKTDFSDADAEKIKAALKTLFVNDASSARPEGSMEVVEVIWWKHNNKNGQYSSAKVHRSLEVKLKDEQKEPESISDYDIILNPLDGLNPEIIPGQ